MKYHVLTLFPEMIQEGMKTSVTGRAIDKGILSLDTVDIRDFTLEKHGKVDDYPYGGGAGMVMQAEPVYRAFQSLCENRREKQIRRVIYLTPQGQVFHQKMAEEFAREEELVFLCGHYEGIDERVLEEIVTDYVSIGDYVLTGGELPAMVMMDAISRLVPGVLNNAWSAKTESFEGDLLEYPQYSRPELWRGKKVPDVLLSGDHKKIQGWRLCQAEERTKLRRQDLYAAYEKKQRAIRRLSKNKRLHMHMIEALRRGLASLLYEGADGVYLYIHNAAQTCMITAKDKASGIRILDQYPPPGRPELFVSCQEYLNSALMERFGYTECNACYQADYSRNTKQKEPAPGLTIQSLDEGYVDFVAERYELESREGILERIRSGYLYGAWNSNGELLGFAGFHDEGSMGFLYVEEACRGRGIGITLETFLLNQSLDRGQTPYCNIFEGNEASVRLQQKLGLNIAKDRIYWLSGKNKENDA